MDSAAGSGTAFEPKIVATDGESGAPTEAPELVRGRLVAELDADILVHRGKVAKQQAHLAGARKGLAEAIAARKRVG